MFLTTNLHTEAKGWFRPKQGSWPQFLIPSWARHWIMVMDGNLWMNLNLWLLRVSPYTKTPRAFLGTKTASNCSPSLKLDMYQLVSFMLPSLFKSLSNWTIAYMNSFEFLSDEKWLYPKFLPFRSARWPLGGVQPPKIDLTRSFPGPTGVLYGFIKPNKIFEGAKRQVAVDTWWKLFRKWEMCTSENYFEGMVLLQIFWNHIKGHTIFLAESDFFSLPKSDQKIETPGVASDMFFSWKDEP